MKKRDYSLERYSFSYKNILDFIKEFFWIRKIILKENPDIIVAMDVNCNIHTGLMKWLFRKKIKTVFITTSDLEGNLNQRSTRFVKLLLKRIISFFYNRSDLLIGLSKDLADSLRSGFKIRKNITTIFNGLDFLNTPTMRDQPYNSVILTVARLDKQKDHMTLLRAFELVTKEIKDACLWIVGDGPLKSDLMSYVTRNNFHENVKFFGWQKNLNEIFLKSDIFVLSSNREGFPYALIEALASGLPAVCTNTPFGPREILEDGKYGYLVPMKDHIKMKDALLELLQNSETYAKYSRLAIEKSSLLTSERMINEYANEIRKLL
jgi:glycosyltransferase involved in cell wall biosynthesis